MPKRQVTWNPTSVPTFWINHASRALMRRFEETLRPLGFSMAYLQVASILKEEGPLQQRALVDRIRVEQPTMAAQLKRMERDGIITRKPDPSDSRAQLVVLTPRARRSLDDARVAMMQVVDEALAGISEEAKAGLVEALQIVIRNLSGDVHEAWP